MSAIALTLQERFPKFSQLSSSEGTVVVQARSGSLRLTPRVLIQREDPFTRLKVSTLVFVEGSNASSPQVKADLGAHIESCQLIVGVVADPSFDIDDDFHAAVFTIGREFEGVVFNGDEVLDANGEPLVSRS